MAGGLTGESQGCFMLYHKGSGIWYWTGKTAVYDAHKPTFDAYGLDWRAKNAWPKVEYTLINLALRRGLTSLQFWRYNFANEFEVIDLKGVGRDACCGMGRQTPVTNFRAGWEASRPCNCNPKSGWLNCAAGKR